MPASAPRVLRNRSPVSQVEPREAPPALRVVYADEPAVALRDGDEGWSYGWVMVAAATLMVVASAPGQTYGFTFFNPWLRKDLSLSQTQLSATYLVATLLAALPLGHVGAMIDRFGTKSSVVVAVVGLAAACGVAAGVHSIPALLAACATMRLCGPGVMTLLSNNILADWFDRRLGLASGAVQLGGAASVALVPLGMQALIASTGWREAYAVVAGLLAIGVLPVVWLTYRDHPDDGPSEAERDIRPSSAGERSFDLRGAMGTRAFWILIAASAIWSLIGTGLIFHLDALLAERGIDARYAGRATAAMAICMAIGQLAAGILADRICVRWHFAAALAILVGVCLVIVRGDGLWPVAAYGFYGFAQGTISVASMTVWARFFGREHLGRIRGTVLTASIGGSAIGPVIMGASADYLGGFGPSLGMLAAAAAVVAACTPWAQRPKMCDV